MVCFIAAVFAAIRNSNPDAIRGKDPVAFRGAGLYKTTLGSTAYVNSRAVDRTHNGKGHKDLRREEHNVETQASGRNELVRNLY